MQLNDDDMQGDQNMQMANMRTSQMDSQTATNVKNHFKLVEEVLEVANKSLQEYKQEVEKLQQDLRTMQQGINNQNEEIKNITNPSIDEELRVLKLAISQQKDLNQKLQSEITDLKKEKSQIQQLIIACVKKVAQLEDQVGTYT